jgi:hypothetical protein
MNTRRFVDLLQVLVALTFPLWSLVLWLDIHVRLLLGIFLIFDPHSHQLTRAFEHAFIYAALYGFLVLYEPATGAEHYQSVMRRAVAVQRAH